MKKVQWLFDDGVESGLIPDVISYIMMIYGYYRWISYENPMISFIMWRRGAWNLISLVVVWYKFCFDFQQCIFPYVELDTSTLILFSLKLLPPKIELQLKVLKPLLGLYFILHSLSFLHNIINFLLVNVTSGFEPIISPSTNSCGMRKWYLSQSSLYWHDYHLLQNVACCRFH